MPDYSVHVHKNLQVPYQFTTHSGKPAKVDDKNPPTITGDNDAVATASLDGVNALINSVGEGTVNFTISGDADLGDGVTAVSRTFSVEVKSETAERVELGAGVEVDK